MNGLMICFPPWHIGDHWLQRKGDWYLAHSYNIPLWCVDKYLPCRGGPDSFTHLAVYTTDPHEMDIIAVLLVCSGYDGWEIMVAFITALSDLAAASTTLGAHGSSDDSIFLVKFWDVMLFFVAVLRGETKATRVTVVGVSWARILEPVDRALKISW